MQKKNFGSQPSNYVPGRGRGAVGFITRSDIGPAKVDIGLEQDDDQNDYNDAKYDEWNGYSIPLFNVGDYDEEDKEADITYNQVDKKMEDRRLSKKRQNFQQEKPSIVNQFSDLKRELAQVTYEDWMSIPDIGDYSIKKKKQDRFTPMPDSILIAANKDSALNTQAHDLNEIGEARGTLLSLKLDKISDNVSGQSVVDTRGYLTSLSQIPQLTESEIGDFKKARLLLKSVIQTDPKNSFGWIAAARVEELDGKLQAARSILAQGLQKAEDQEDLWIELARLETPEKAKQILSKAMQTLPHSVKIWLNASSKENDNNSKIKILKKALEFIPNSVDIWKELISLSSEQEALVLLYKAVECIPKHLAMWLALAKLETYENARFILNRARMALPQEPTIWINAAKLEESSGKDQDTITTVLRKGIKVLQKNGVKIIKDDWLNEAEIAEKCQNFFTCRAIVHAIYNDDDENWKQDFDFYHNRNSIYTARAIIRFAAEKLKSKEIFEQCLKFERIHSKSLKNSFYDETLRLALEYCPLIDEFWIEYINRLFETEQNYEEAIQKSPKTENILIAISKIQIKLKNYEMAKQYLLQAQQFNTVLSQIKLIKLLKLMNLDIESPDEILARFPDSDKIWCLCAEIKIQHGNIDGARKLFELGLLRLNNSLNLWCSYIQMECQQSNYQRARPLIDRAKVKFQKCPELWIAAIRLEVDANLKRAATILLSKALQECPRHGELWALAIELEPKNTRKKKSADAVTLCVDNPYVYLSTAKVFLKEGKLEKAQRWLEKALILEPKLGDAWAYLYLIDKQILAQCISKEPKFGRLWKLAKQKLNLKYNYEQLLQETAKYAQQEIVKLD